MRTALSPTYAQISAIELQNLSQHNSVLYRFSQFPCLGARGCPQVLFTALTVPVVVSTSLYIALVINLWLHDISSRDSLPGDNLLKPVPRALKNLVSGCRTSHQNPQCLSHVPSMQPPPGLRSLFQDLVDKRITLGCDCFLSPQGLSFLGIAECFLLPWAVQCSPTQSGRQDTSKQNMMAGNVMEVIQVGWDSLHLFLLQ